MVYFPFVNHCLQYLVLLILQDPQTPNFVYLVDVPMGEGLRIKEMCILCP